MDETNAQGSASIDSAGGEVRMHVCLHDGFLFRGLSDGQLMHSRCWSLDDFALLDLSERLWYALTCPLSALAHDGRRRGYYRSSGNLSTYPPDLSGNLTQMAPLLVAAVLRVSRCALVVEAFGVPQAASFPGKAYRDCCTHWSPLTVSLFSHSAHPGTPQARIAESGRRRRRRARCQLRSSIYAVRFLGGPEVRPAVLRFCGQVVAIASAA